MRDPAAFRARTVREAGGREARGPGPGAEIRDRSDQEAGGTNPLRGTLTRRKRSFRSRGARMSDRGGDHGVTGRADGATAPPSGPVVIDPAATPADPPDRPPEPATRAPSAAAPAVPKPVATPPAKPSPAAASPAPPPAPAPHASFELQASRLAGGVPDLLRRVPFTATIVLGTLIVGVVARTVWSPIWRASWFPEVAYGTPALREGKIWTLLTGWWFYLTPGQYLSGLFMFAVIVGACEIRLGTRAVAISAVAGEIGGILLASLLVWALSATSWPWAIALARSARRRLHHGHAHRPRGDHARRCARPGGCGCGRRCGSTSPSRSCSRARSPTSPTRSPSGSGSSSGSGCSAWNRGSGRAPGARPACSPSAG